VNHVRKVRRLNAVLTNEPVAAATFYLRRDFWMGSLAPAPNPYVGTVEVPTLSLDNLLRDEAINLVVCDVEGAEVGLFDGADLSNVDRIYLETHDHVTGLSGIRRLFATMAEQGFVYDPRHSLGSVVLFQRLGDQDIVRPYTHALDDSHRAVCKRASDRLLHPRDAGPISRHNNSGGSETILHRNSRRAAGPFLRSGGPA
jgi:hypothetical protein